MRALGRAAKLLGLAAAPVAFALLGLGCAVTRPVAEAAPSLDPAVSDRAEAYLAALPALPPDWRFDRFEPEPGVVLETGFLPARGERRGTAIVVPGFTAPLELHADEYARLARAGWDVAALSQRGQGRSARLGPVGTMGHVESFADLASDLRRFAAAQEGPVVVMGISMGGHTALRLAAEDAGAVRAVATIVPMVGIQTGDVPVWQARLLSGAMDRFGLGRRYAPGGGPWEPTAFLTDAPPEGGLCTDDPARAHLRDALFVRHPELRAAAPSVGWVAAALRSQAWLRGRGGAIDVPLMMVTVGGERLVDNDAAVALCEASGCERLHLPEAMHCLLEGDTAEDDAVIDAVADFFARAVR